MRGRTGVALAIAIIMVFSMSGCKKAETAEKAYKRADNIESFAEAKTILKEGNACFVNDTPRKKEISAERIEKLAKNGQKPFAVIVCCSDSRVPPEIIFDQALGDLFVVRTAGNVVDDVAMGSIEYGTEHLGAKVVVVLGHSKCGAVKATIEGTKEGKFPGSIGAIVKLIEPSLREVEDSGVKGEKRFAATENENIWAMVDKIEKSPIIEELSAMDEVNVIGAKYDVDTGKVSFK